MGYYQIIIFFLISGIKYNDYIKFSRHSISLLSSRNLGPDKICIRVSSFIDVFHSVSASFVPADNNQPFLIKSKQIFQRDLQKSFRMCEVALAETNVIFSKTYDDYNHYSKTGHQ